MHFYYKNCIKAHKLVNMKLFKNINRKILHILLASLLISLSKSHECMEINPTNYGDCDMSLGIAWTSDGCIQISGCDWFDQYGNDNSEYFFNTIEECQYLCTSHNGIMGDLNEDSTINILDIVLLVNIIINNIIPSNHIQWSGDLNTDTILNVLDIVLAVNIVLDASTETRGTWEIIRDDILVPRCASCHIAGSFYAEQSGLILTADVAYNQIINSIPTNNSAADDGLVQVSDTGGILGLQLSYLWEKINVKDEEYYLIDHPFYGELMPLGGPYLNNGQLAFIEQWILAGAPSQGVSVDPVLLSDTTIYSAPEFEILEAPENGIQLHLGPFDVPPGGDMELLSYENLNFTEDVFIKRVKVSMRPEVIILYSILLLMTYPVNSSLKGRNKTIL